VNGSASTSYPGNCSNRTTPFCSRSLQSPPAADGSVERTTRAPGRVGAVDLDAAGYAASLRATASWRPVEDSECCCWVGHCRPRTSAIRSLNLGVSFLAVRSRTLLSLADPNLPPGLLQSGRTASHHSSCFASTKGPFVISHTRPVAVVRGRQLQGELKIVVVMRERLVSEKSRTRLRTLKPPPPPKAPVREARPISLPERHSPSAHIDAEVDLTHLGQLCRRTADPRHS